MTWYMRDTSQRTLHGSLSGVGSSIITGPDFQVRRVWPEVNRPLAKGLMVIRDIKSKLLEPVPHQPPNTQIYTHSALDKQKWLRVRLFPLPWTLFQQPSPPICSANLTLHIRFTISLSLKKILMDCGIVLNLQINLWRIGILTIVCLVLFDIFLQCFVVLSGGMPHILLDMYLSISFFSEQL